jgi:hypothetical protein
MSMEVLTKKFTAYSNDGDFVSLLEYRTVINTSTAEGPSSRLGLKRITTENGRAVNCIDGGFQVLGETEIFYENSR